jgi:carboxylesterase type B
VVSNAGRCLSDMALMDLSDPTKLVSSAIVNDTPMIYVAINYRLAFLGLTYFSDEQSNFGLFDQKHAIEWVHQHIKGFGGDPVRPYPYPIS